MRTNLTPPPTAAKSEMIERLGLNPADFRVVQTVTDGGDCPGVATATVHRSQVDAFIDARRRDDRRFFVDGHEHVGAAR